ncbi:fungal specific transcription factor domain-containing protein [Colletotrichum graminicola]|uniref:Fungal specific transcription factor domain-containing protein n=1 Tax=Colletotrichum graminicola (strain M1.001 / M2 / FGSC 10212) TaxID=645133 RepID=E3QCI3_COLGM|nr:fungal specific transcription factor domain-containing protein [Colletotrichum graminicola M1.001]EFQ28571.1 fungal specific transcription factor domain-containing protein [Colletotrichum graminicola M1.001]WDK15926.1 fungal specific transcription factor domain-containing protein [Colletotrichum graminicola]
MTRPKVPDDKRQRTAQACDTCKRRKQKCNGTRPCATCTKRSLVCTYTTSNGSEQALPDQIASPSKRRNIEEPPAATPVAPEGSLASASPAAATTPWESKPQQPATEDNPTVGFDIRPSVENDHEATAGNREFDIRSRHSTASGPDEETSLIQSTRMLQDPTGRLLYVGDSASLAYLQLIRMIVEASVGPSDFTLDPNRHKIMEATITMPANIRPPHILPDRDTANAMTRGLIEVFNRAAFEKSLETCYSDPLAAQSSFLCLLYLTFAIGTVLGTPLPGSKQDAIFKKLRASEYDRAELFFRSAKALGDPITGFEDADFWSVQALSLMSVYMLAVSKRNAAYAYFGMAVRSGFALGLHRVQENHFIFKSHEIRLRRNLWRSLFVLDRFLAASLGRPVAIDEEECSTEALLVFEKNAQGELVRVTDPNDGLDAAVRSCRIIGQILKKIYARRRISVRLAQEIWERCSSWYSTLSSDLAGGKVAADPGHPAQGIAALHVNLLYCHSILLLTRPFFLCLLSKVHGERSGLNLPVPRWIHRMSRYCEACLHASSQTINLVQKAYESNYLPQRNPFVLYFLFAASLIILSNEFAAVYPNPGYETSISNTIAIMSYCAASDPQANRLLFILTSFRNVIYELRQKKTEQPAMSAPPTLSPTSFQDPIGIIFQSSRVSRKNSFATITSGPSAVAVKAMAPPPPSMKTEHGFSTPTGPPAGHSPAGSTPGMSQSEQSVRMSGDSDTADGELEFDQLWGWSAVSNMAGGAAPPALMTAATPPNAPPAFPGRGPGQGHQGFPSFIVPGGHNGSGVPAVAPSGYVATPNVPLFVPAEYS